jgi:hypothetical protein
MQEFDLTALERDVSYLVRLPKGRLMEIEWVDSEADIIRVLGFVTERQYLADEQYRCAGHEPQLRRFRGDIPMGDAWVND